MIGMSEFMKVRHIQGIFNNAYRSPNSLVIIDEIERILEYVRMGNKFSNAILQCLYVCLKKMPDKLENKICIIGTSADRDLLRDLGLWESFNLKYEVKSLGTPEEIKSCLRTLLPGCSGVEQLKIRPDMQINIKELYQFASSVGQKIEKYPSYDIRPDFEGLIRQLSN
jgi:vesicle-fusing ATPase